MKNPILKEAAFGTKTKIVDSDTPPEEFLPRQKLKHLTEDTSDERKMQHEILNRVIRAVDGVMRASKNPRLVWAVLAGTWLDQKTVPEICREECAVERTVRYILVEICAALKSVSV